MTHLVVRAPGYGNDGGIVHVANDAALAGDKHLWHVVCWGWTMQDRWQVVAEPGLVPTCVWCIACSQTRFLFEQTSQSYVPFNGEEP